jgi:hypothetical protein
MIIYKNNVVVTPVKTGTNTLSRILFDKGASILHSNPKFLNTGEPGSTDNALFNKV